jgi:hypothetical protein
MYVLYKNPIELDTLYIVQYLNYVGFKLLPMKCIERNHPSWVTDLPSIKTIKGDMYIGLRECLIFYETESNISNLQYKAKSFKEKYPDYKINN